MEHRGPGVAPRMLEFQELRQEDPDDLVQTIIGRSLEIGNASVDIAVRVATYYPTATHPYGGGIDLMGKRTMLGVYASRGRVAQLIQLLPRPSEFSRHGAYDSALRQEKKILRLLATQHRRPDLVDPDGEGSIGSVVMPLPCAHQTVDAVYESTAPGILLRSVIEAVTESHELGEFSDQEVALLLAKMHSSALASLRMLHSLGIKHYHPHIDNFNIDIHSGNATLFDYTFAVSRNAEDTYVRADSGKLTGDNLEQDIQEFEKSWLEAVNATDLGQTASASSTDTLSTDDVIGRLEPTIIRSALRKLELTTSDDDVRRFIAVQNELIRMTPDIYYPKDTFDQRLKARLVAARLALRNR